MLSSIASFLPSALHLNNSSATRPAAINPDTEDEGELEDDEPRRENAPRSYAQQQQSESTTELHGQQQAVKGGGKSANEVGVFALAFGGQGQAGEQRGRWSTRELARDEDLYERFVELFLLSCGWLVYTLVFFRILATPRLDKVLRPLTVALSNHPKLPYQFSLGVSLS
jgi:hypothetical protein